MALRMLLGRSALLSKGPATARHFFRSALASDAATPPSSRQEMDAYIAGLSPEQQLEWKGLQGEKFVEKFSAAFAEPPKSAGRDIVKEVFYRSQRKFRHIAEATVDLKLPDADDEDGIREYAHARNEILKELKIHTPEESMISTLRREASEMREEGGTAKAYLAFVAQQRVAMGINDGGLGKALEAAVAAHEKARGKPLMMSDTEELKAVVESIEELLEELDIEDYADNESLRDDMFESAVQEAEYEMGQLAEKRAARVEAERARYGEKPVIDTGKTQDQRIEAHIEAARKQRA